MKILNLYANIGGNRKLWGDEHEITAVELNPKLAEAYADLYPNDTVVIGDAHQYLLDHYKEFDFIWSSPPCPTHSKARYGLGVGSGQVPAVYPDMKLYEEIILLSTHFKGKWCVENVIAYYKPLIAPWVIGRHYYWTNFYLNTDIAVEPSGITSVAWRPIRRATIDELQDKYGFDLSKYSGFDKKLALRDCVEPEIGKHILDWAMKDEHASLFA